jgi:galactokinase
MAGVHFLTESKFSPTHVVRAPGRVNLIGEHIDYHHLPVLPIAIDREILLHFRTRPDRLVRACSTAPSTAEVSFELGREIPTGPPGDWSNYLRAAAQSLVRSHGVDRGMEVAGLSSSSALVVATGLALAEVGGVRIAREDLASQMAEAERYTGTRGGGMDQATCLLAREGHALHLRFAPLRARPIPVPAHARLIVAHSLERAEKSGAAQEAYNTRRRVGEDARETVARKLGLAADTPYRVLAEDPARALDASAAVLEGSSRAYFRHVLTEADRVDRAVEALEARDVDVLGALMNASHESLRVDYEVSTPGLDELVEIAREAGASGARLTGAGFGGAIVAIAQPDAVDTVLGALRTRFYVRRDIPDPDARGLLLTVRPSAAAAVVELSP